MAARSLEGMFANIDVERPGSPHHSPPRSVSTLSDGGDTVISVHSTDSEGTVDTVPYEHREHEEVDGHSSRTMQSFANGIKDLLKMLEQPYEERLEGLRRLYQNRHNWSSEFVEDYDFNEDTDEDIVREIRGDMIQFIHYIPGLRETFIGDDMPPLSATNNTQIRAVLTNPRFKELFSQDEYASLKEKLGMENVGGGRRRHKSAKKHHKRRYNKKTHNKKHKKSSKKTRSRKHKKSMRKHKKVVRKTSKKTHRRRR